MFDDTPLVMVEDDEALAKLVATLSEAPVIGVDTESDSMYSYQEKVCLLQFSDSERDYIVDPLKIKDMSPLGAVMSNPDIVKIFHGADYDVVCMNRDYGFKVVNLFDTMVAAQFLAFSRLGLADLIERNFGHHIEKKFQRHDWSRRPLLPEHLDYARGDTHWLLAIRELMLWKLTAANRMAHLEEECAILEKRVWRERKRDPNSYLRVKGTRDLNDTAKRVLFRLYEWRDGVAKAANRPPYKVVPDPVLVELARKQPESRDALERMFSRKTAMKRRYGAALVEAVLAGLEDDFEVPTSVPSKKKNNEPQDLPPARIWGGLLDRTATALKDWRNGLIRKDPSLTSVTIVSNGQLKSIAATRPTTLEELGALPDVRNWQVRDHGEAIIAVLDEVAPPISEDEDGAPVFQARGEGRRRRRRR
ncbi:MAG: HRDC domain-containing protein [Proteobacteria bacterium]|nr:HRDC domain-containing protein [Pseudomonadota bacterium]